MTKNLGSADRIIRAIIGLALVGWGIYAQNWWGAIGAVPLFTALTGWCPLYLPLHVSTNK